MTGAVALALAAALPDPLHGDFDSDGLRDTAAVLREGDGTYRLAVVRGAEPERAVTVTSIGEGGAIFLGILPPGVYATACARGSGPDRSDCVTEVRLAGDTLAFGTEESSMAAVLWTEGRFSVVWLHD